MSLKRAVGSPPEEAEAEDEDDEGAAAAAAEVSDSEEGGSSQSWNGSTREATGTMEPLSSPSPPPPLHQATARASPAVEARTSIVFGGFCSPPPFEVDAFAFERSAAPAPAPALA